MPRPDALLCVPWFYVSRPKKNYDFELPLKFREAELHKVPRYRHSQNCANLRRVQKKMKKSETQNAKKKQTNPRRPQQS
jgi:hypothetical protein